jgi:phage-related protein
MAYKVKLMQPAADFLERIPIGLKTKAFRTLRLLEEFGPLLREPHSKKVTGWPGLFELRVAIGRDACRLFCFWHGLAFYVVTSGYIKKAMKLDRKELDRAFTLMKRFLDENDGGRHEDI